MKERCVAMPPVYFSIGAASMVHAIGPRAKISYSLRTRSRLY